MHMLMPVARTIEFIRPWTITASATMSTEVMTVVHKVTTPLTVLGIKNSYQNEGDAFESDWQQGMVTVST